MKKTEKDTLEVMAEKAIYAFNEASRTMYEMIKNNQIEKSRAIKVIKAAIRKKTAFKKAYFAAFTPGFEMDAVEELIPELETAIDTYNKVLEQYARREEQSLTK